MPARLKTRPHGFVVVAAWIIITSSTPTRNTATASSNVGNVQKECIARQRLIRLARFLRMLLFLKGGTVSTTLPSTSCNVPNHRDSAWATQRTATHYVTMDTEVLFAWFASWRLTSGTCGTGKRVVYATDPHENHCTVAWRVSGSLLWVLCCIYLKVGKARAFLERPTLKPVKWRSSLKWCRPSIKF